MRVLLLNPPGREVYIRDYFCSKTTKSSYLFHPVDLLALSGTLAASHEVLVLDAIAERLSPAAARARIDTLDPEVVVSLVGSVSWEEDRAFLAGLHAGGRRVLAIGDVLHEDAGARLAEEPWLEVALDDFTNEDALHAIAGRHDLLERATWRDASGTIHSRRAPHPSKEFRLPRPRHELFPRRGYRFSFARHARFATVLTDYGCPYPCTFCVIGTLGFKTRPVVDVLEELDALRADGVRELFFMDQTFGVRRDRALELCAELARRGDLSWTAFTRPDTADGELLEAMARAGCHTVILGVESASDELLESYRKGYDARGVGAAVRRARAAGLRVVGTFIVGLPEDTAESLEDSLQLAIELELDFMSLNVAVPRFGTGFRARVVQDGLASREELVMDQGGATAALATRTLGREEVLAIKRRMVRRFYLRPGYLLRRLCGVRSLAELLGQAREGLALIGRNL